MPVKDIRWDLGLKDVSMKLFIAQTIDGYIAGPDDSLDHLKAFGGEEHGYANFIKTVDAIVMGRRTFDVIYSDHGWTYPPELPGVVVTSRPLPEDVPNHVNGSANIDRIAEEYSNAFVDGGGQVVRAFCERNLIREAHIFTLPVLLGDGIPLFAPGKLATQTWQLVDVKAFPDGSVLHHYKA
jgi:dihydrofolate reductase